MKRKEEPLPWIQTYQDLLLELRCREDPQHRIEAAELLLDQEDYPDRITHLVSAAIYEPDEEVKDKVLRLLYDRFGNNLYRMIDVEKSDGKPIEEPWLTDCTDPENVNKSESDKSTEPISYFAPDYESLLKEIRCEKYAQHRIEAARALAAYINEPNRIAHLANVVLYDPDPEVRRQVKKFLFDLYGKELETILQVEGADGVPLESPWMIPCQMSGSHGNPPTVTPKTAPEGGWDPSDELEDLHNALRDPLDVKNRLSAAKALAKNHTDENLAMLAKAVLFDPDENVQQQAYQSLYEAAGDDKAEKLLDEIGANSSYEEEDWLLIPGSDEEYQDSIEPKEESSPFGINKADQVRGMVNLFTGEKDPQKRIAILQALGQSTDVNANEAIARVGLFDSEARVREYAKTMLAVRLGGHLDAFLEHIYASASAYHADPEAEDETPEPARTYDPYSTQLNMQPSVIQEGPNLMPYIILAGLVIFGLVMYLILR